MDILKATFTGSLEFGGAKTYEIMLKMVLQKIEVYYKNDVLLKPEIFFFEENANLVVYKYTTLCTEKNWKNTVSLLECIAQFAVAGKLETWLLAYKPKPEKKPETGKSAETSKQPEPGKLIGSRLIEPMSEKSTVQDFRKAVAMTGVAGREDEAVDGFTRVIEKFDRHVFAYERRGYAHYKLRHFDDAILDYTKSIHLLDNPEAHFGRAIVKVAKGDISGAITDLEIAIKLSLPLQPVFWMARRVKGECHFKQNDFHKAIFELKFVTKRDFKPEDANFAYRHRAWHYYGEALLKSGETTESVKAFNQAAAIENAMKDAQKGIINKVEEPKLLLKRALGVA